MIILVKSMTKTEIRRYNKFNILGYIYALINVIKRNEVSILYD